MTLRKGIHRQIKDIFVSVLDGIGQSKHEAKESNFASGGRRESDLIHSVRTREAYLRNMHLFGEFLKEKGELSILDFQVGNLEWYLSNRVDHFRKIRGSYGSYQQEVAAIRKLLRGIELYAEDRGISLGIDLSEARAIIRESVREAGSEIINPGLLHPKRGMTKAPWYRRMGTRRYDDPLEIICRLKNAEHILQASIQLEGGCRAEGVGAPKSSIPNPLTQENLRGLCPDPVTGNEVGSIFTVEKGGKGAYHFLSKDLYEDLSEYVGVMGKLESTYDRYLYALNTAARQTGQFYPGRGTHGLRHNFAYRRYYECIDAGYGNYEAKACVSAELNHNRLDITDTYL
jgi:integrase